MSKQNSAIDNTKEVVSTYVTMPISKPEITDNVTEVYMIPTTSDNSSVVDSSLGKNRSINLSDTSLSITAEPTNNLNVPTIITTEIEKTVVDLSIVKIEPYDDDYMPESLETNVEHIYPITEIDNSANNNSQSSSIHYLDVTSEQTTQQSNENPTIYSTPAAEQNLTTETDENYDDLFPLTSIDDSSYDSISNLKQKLKTISANSSLSITLEPIENTKVIEPSVDLSSKTPTKSSMSITLQPKPNPTALTPNNSSPSVTLTHSLPSTSSNPVYSISQPSPIQCEQESASTSNVSDNLPSNTTISSEFINNQMLYLKSISPNNRPNEPGLPELPEINRPGILENNTNSDNSTNTTQLINDKNNTEGFVVKDDLFIYTISLTAVLPNLFWVALHCMEDNSTSFVQRNDFYETVKKVIFNNSLMPVIHVFGKKYKYDKPIKTKIQLENLLEKLDNFEKCYGNDGLTHEKCIGYFEEQSEDVEMCSVCQESVKNQDLHTIKTIIQSKSNTIENLKNKVSILAY